VVLHYSNGETNSGAVVARMKNLKPDTPIILLCGDADESVDEPLVDVLVQKVASPNILLAKLSEAIYSNYSSVAKKPHKAKPTKASWVA